VSKGTDNALMVGTSGDAHYMELAGTSVQVGTSLFVKMREGALEVAQCVVPDPNQIGSAGTSSVALKVIYAPMLGKSDILREQYERGLQALLMQIVRSVRRMFESEDVFLDLPPRSVDVAVLDEFSGEPTGVIDTQYLDQHPGSGTVLTFDWGDYFMPTAQDQQQTATTLTQLVGSQLLSLKSGADLASRIVRIDPRADWDQLQEEKKTKAQDQQQMFGDAGPDQSGGEPPMGGMGGRVGSRDELPDGAVPRRKRDATTDSKGKLDKAMGMMKVDEARAAMGLEPLGDEDGRMTVAAFQAKAKAGERIAVEREKASIEDKRRKDATLDTLEK
jgi:hypothetical protein